MNKDSNKCYVCKEADTSLSHKHAGYDYYLCEKCHNENPNFLESMKLVIKKYKNKGKINNEREKEYIKI